MVCVAEGAVNGRSGRTPLGHGRQRPFRGRRRVGRPTAGGWLRRRAVFGGPVRRRVRFGRRREAHSLRAGGHGNRGSLFGDGWLQGTSLENRLKPPFRIASRRRRSRVLFRLVDGRLPRLRRFPDAPDGSPVRRPPDERAPVGHVTIDDNAAARLLQLPLLLAAVHGCGRRRGRRHGYLDLGADGHEQQPLLL